MTRAAHSLLSMTTAAVIMLAVKASLALTVLAVSLNAGPGDATYLVRHPWLLLRSFLAMNVVMRMYLLRDVWARVVTSATVYNLEAAANVSAKGEMANALGEGFADGLDVAGF